MSLSLPAAAQTWTGTTSTDWTDGTNWSTGTVPTNLTDAGINTTAPNVTVLGVGGAAIGSTDDLIVATSGLGSLTIQNGSTLTSAGATLLGGFGGSSGVVTVTGAGSRWNNTSASVLALGNSGSATLKIQDGGTVTALGGVRLGSGATSNGTLNINSGGTLETTALLRGFFGTKQVNIDNGTLRALSNNATWIASGFTGTQLNIAAGGLTLDSNGFAVTVASPLSGVGGVTKVGAGTVTFNTAQTYTGETVVQSGTLALTNTGSVTGSSRVVVDGTFDISGVTAAGSDIQFLAGGGAVELGTKTLTILNASSIFSGSITGSGALAIGGGTQFLTGANTYTGGTVIAVGSALRIGDGGASGSIVGNVANDGALTFNRSDDPTFAGAVSGSGNLTKLGGGTLTLTGDSTYTGGTTISAGALQIGDGGTSGSITGNVANNGTLAFNRSDDIVFAGAISGSGGVQKLGGGWLTLTGVNSYSGGTLIAGGFLQVGNGSTTGSIQGDVVVNNGVLAFNRSDAVTFGGAISGNGLLFQFGTGTTTLTGTNTYSGGTVIGTGTLIGSSTSFGSEGIGNFGALVIDQPTDATFGNAINETGSFTKRGAGNLNLTGTGSLSGATTVEAGKLSVNGSLASSAVTVLSGASLGGSGTVGATTIQSGATIAPGNSIGTLTVNGNLVLAAGSTYEVEISGAGGSDRIAASGTATVGGSQVGVTALDPQTSYINGQRYTIITANGGVVGTLAGVVSRSAFLDLSAEHLPNQIDLVIAVKGSTPGPTPPATFEAVAQTRNQVTTAVALDTLPQVGGTLALYNSLLMLDAGSARHAFDQLSGEIYASTKSALIEDSHFVRDAVNDRIRSAFGDATASDMPLLAYGPDGARQAAADSIGPLAWGYAFGSWGAFDGNGNAASMNTSTGGFLTGIDGAIASDMRLGLLAGYSHTSFDVDGRASSGSSDNYHVGLYGGGKWNALRLTGGLAYTWHDIDTSRSVAFPGFSDSLNGDYDAGTFQVFGEAGYRIDLGRVALEPFAGLAYVNLHTDGFSEDGGAAALSGRSDDISLGYSTPGLRASTSFALHGIDLTVRGGLAWRHAFGEVDPEATLAFAGSNPFSVAGVPIARDAAVVEAGLDLAISRSASLGISYAGQLAHDRQDHAFKANLAVSF
ncbi:autotransporter domain-containing protein [Mesorhizobium sp. B2-2-3]|uniref:autotransporter domain-containing protein n=1 Tax=Mesorhizobium sp. B2-2-3 TaxID=2589963 RepID=UPI0015E2E94E|nr:autotransporter domain-containing protein [Mesorhizobium sp. B2-2-3]